MFDPYHLWLGISPKDQPPNYYRALGIPEFEDNLDVIEAGADRQMAHVRTFQQGVHAADSQRILNEIAAAKICLLKPEYKAAYDFQLRGTLGLKPSGVQKRPKVIQTALPIPANNSPEPEIDLGDRRAADLNAFAAADIASVAHGRARSVRHRFGARAKPTGWSGPWVYLIALLSLGAIGLAGILWVNASHLKIQLIDENKIAANDPPKSKKAAPPAKSKATDVAEPKVTDGNPARSTAARERRIINERPAPPGLGPVVAKSGSVNAEPSRPVAVRTADAIGTSESTGREWRYATERPAQVWKDPGFDDANWRVALGVFGSLRQSRTRWSTRDIWLRRTFELTDLGSVPSTIRIIHDDDAEVYINGVLAGRFGGWVPNYIEARIDQAALRAYVEGKNVLAVHCRQLVGNQSIDVGLVGLIPPIDIALPQEPEFSATAIELAPQAPSADKPMAGDKTMENFSIDEMLGNSHFGIIRVADGYNLSEKAIDISFKGIQASYKKDALVWCDSDASGLPHGAYSMTLGGHLNGPTTELFPEGGAELYVTYDDGQRSGTARIWGAKNTRQFYAQYERNKEHGLACVFRSGKPWYVEVMNAGKLDSSFLMVEANQLADHFSDAFPSPEIKPSTSSFLTAPAFTAIDSAAIVDKEGVASIAAAQRKMNRMRAFINEREKAYKTTCKGYAEGVRKDLAVANNKIKRHNADVRDERVRRQNSAFFDQMHRASGGGY